MFQCNAPGLLIDGGNIMKREVVLIFSFLCVWQRSYPFTLGNFTTQDFRFTVLDNKVTVLRKDFVLDSQHYIDLGTVSQKSLPLKIQLWSKDAAKRDETSVRDQFLVQSVPDKAITFRDTDMWLIYQPDGKQLAITNVTNQQAVISQGTPEKLAPTPTPEPIQESKKEPAKETAAEPQKQEQVKEKATEAPKPVAEKEEKVVQAKPVAAPITVSKKESVEKSIVAHDKLVEKGSLSEPS